MIEIKSSSEFEALATLQPKRRLYLTLADFKLTSDDATRLLRVDQVAMLTLRNLTFESERSKREFIEAVAEKKISELTCARVECPFRLEKCLASFGRYPISRSLKKVFWCTMPLTAFRARLISRAIQHNNVLDEMGITSSTKSQSDLVPFLLLLKPLYRLNLHGYKLTPAECYALYERVKRGQQTADSLLSGLYLDLKDEYKEIGTYSLKWGGYIAEKKVIDYVHLYGIPRSDEEKGFVKYLESLAKFDLHRH